MVGHQRRIVGLVILTLIAAAISVTITGWQPHNQETHGFLKRTHVFANGQLSHYVVFVPYNQPLEYKLPVILFLNGWGENGDDGLRQISNNFGGDLWRMRGHFPFLAVCPQCSYNGSWAPDTPNAQKALNILDAAIAEFGGDPDRVAITGASAGAKGALALASAHPERFSAVIPVALGQAGNLKTLAEAGMPIWSFYNGRDEAQLAPAAREMRQKLIEMGLSPLASEFDRGGHNAWDSAFGPPALYSWLLHQNRTNPSRKTPFELFVPETVIRTWECRGEQKWKANDEELVFSDPETNEPTLLISPLVGEIAEFHFDIWLDGDQQYRIAILPDENEEQLGMVLIERSDCGSGGFVSPEEGINTTLDPIGQRALRVGWNDVRIARVGKRFLVQLNGWQALDISLTNLSGMIRWGLLVDGDHEFSRWRFLRQRRTVPENWL